MDDETLKQSWTQIPAKNQNIETYYCGEKCNVARRINLFMRTRKSFFYTSDAKCSGHFDFYAILNSLNPFLFSYETLCGCFFVLIVAYWMYRSFFKPLNIVKELTDVGFEHIPRGRHRQKAISRARISRKLGHNIPPPYPDGWFALLESSELMLGEVKAVDALGENFAVFRKNDGKVKIVDAYCPHLGANMGIGGRISDNCIECPFHKWRFDGDTGECVSIPGQDMPIRGVRVRTWYSDEVDNIIWVWHSSLRIPPTWSLEPTKELCDGWRYCGRNSYIVNSHIQDIPENGADVSHLNAVHSVSILTSVDTGEKFSWLQYMIGRHTWEAKWSKGEGHIANIHLKHEYKLLSKVSLMNMDIHAVQIGPGLVRLRSDCMYVIQSVTPIAPLEQKVVHRIYSKTMWMVPFTSIFLLGESAMFERDVKMWNNKRFVANPAYSKSDRTIKTFRNWFSQFYTDQSISFKEALNAQNTLEW